MKCYISNSTWHYFNAVVNWHNFYAIMKHHLGKRAWHYFNTILKMCALFPAKHQFSQYGFGIHWWKTMNIKVPEKILREFVQIAKKNYSTNPKDGPGHIETMSILVGHKSSSQTVVTKLIFPDQIGAPYEVNSEGKKSSTSFSRHFHVISVIFLKIWIAFDERIISKPLGALGAVWNPKNWPRFLALFSCVFYLIWD